MAIYVGMRKVLKMGQMGIWSDRHLETKRFGEEEESLDRKHFIGVDSSEKT